MLHFRKAKATNRLHTLKYSIAGQWRKKKSQAHLKAAQADSHPKLLKELAIITFYKTVKY